MTRLSFARLLEIGRGLGLAEAGQDLVEYGLLVSIIAVGAIASIGPVATAIINLLTNVTNSLA